MAMNPNVTMANMNPMGGPVGGAPVPMMNNASVNPQAAAAAAAARQQQLNDSQRGILNTYIYEYFIRYGMYDCARSLLSSDQQVNVHKDGAGRRRDENGNVVNGVIEDPMDTDTKDDLDGKLPDDLPPPKLPMPTSDTSFLYEWFCLFWDIYNAQRAKGGNGTVNQYVSHTQQLSRLKQSQQDMLRQMRPDMAQQQHQANLMRSFGGNMQMVNKSATLARTAMANNQNPQMQMLQQAKQNPMQRDPSGMDANRGDRPSSPASGENAPSPSKRQRIDGAQFNPNQPGPSMPGGRPGQPMQPQQMAGNPSAAAAHQMLSAHGINPNSLNAQQFQNFANMTPAAQQKSIQAYSQNLQTHHGNQMGNKPMANPAGPQSQGSPMLPPGPDGNSLAAFYNPGEIAGPGALRPGPGGAQQPGGSNHALQDYQMQLMLLEQQNKKRLMMARQEQDNIGGIPRDPNAPNAPGAPTGAIGQPFPDASPQAMRTGTSPNPTDQMKRGTPQMNNSGIPSPVPEGAQSRGSPNPALNFMGNHVDPSQAPHFFNKQGMEGNIAAQQAQMNGMRGPGAHPGQPFNQMNQQQQMMARQQQQQQQPGAQGNPQQWQQQGPNGQMLPQGMQGMQQPQPAQGTPQPRSMPPPSAPAATGTNPNARTTASPQQAAAAPPTPNQSNKAAPKKKDSKNAKDKRATQKKSNPSLNNTGATPAGDNGGEPEAPTPATPITPVNNANFKPGQNGNGAPNGQPTVLPPTGAPGVGAGNGVGPAQGGGTTVSAPSNAAQVPPQNHGDPNQNGSINMDNFGSMVDFPGIEIANPLTTNDVLNDFDFDSFLHDDNTGEHFDFNTTFPSMDSEGISAD